MSVVVGSLCTGYGGLDHAALAALGGGRVAWVADPDPHVTTLLEARLPGVPNLGDIRAVDWRGVEPVDVITAGFPCQDVSAAGRRAGIREGTRSGLFFDVIRAVKTLQPPLVVIENVAALRWRGGGLDIVLAKLHRAGYDCVWTSLRASDVGAPHRRERVFLLGWPRNRPRSHLTDAPMTGPKPRRRATRELHPVQCVTAPAVEAPPVNTSVAWGRYEVAIRRWETVLGRAAPHPVEPGRSGRPRLSARFVEWCMGLDDGFVCGLDLPRTAQLRILGNGVVALQAVRALEDLQAFLPAAGTDLAQAA